MMALEREEATLVVNQVVADLVAQVTVDAGRDGSLFRLAWGDLVAAAEELIETAQVAAAIANVFDLARLAGASVIEMDTVRQHTEAIATSSFAARSVQNTCIRLTLVQSARILADTTLTSRQAVDAYIDRMNDAFDGAETIAGDAKDQASYRSLIALHAAVTFDLTTRERPLPGIVIYDFAVSRPVLWMAQRLYGDAERTEELIEENKPVHPAFCRSPINALAA